MDRYTKLLQSFSQFSAQSVPQHWADLGCGSGVFTEALANMLPSQSSIIGIDKTLYTLNEKMGNQINVIFKKADFVSDDLPITTLDGILMANTLHFVKDKGNLITKLEKYFASAPRFIIVEYEQSIANRWVPNPIAFLELKRLFIKLGYNNITKMAELKSAYGGMMYACFCEKTPF